MPGTPSLSLSPNRNRSFTPSLLPIAQSAPLPASAPARAAGRWGTVPGHNRHMPNSGCRVFVAEAGAGAGPAAEVATEVEAHVVAVPSTVVAGAALVFAAAAASAEVMSGGELGFAEGFGQAELLLEQG